MIAFIAWFVMYKTRFGLHLRACGENPHAVDAAGMQVGRIRLIAVMVSGALSGLGGICFAYSISANFSPSIYVGYGYLAIAAYIFGNWKIMPTLGACLLFGLARSGGYKLVQVLGMPSSYQDLVVSPCRMRSHCFCLFSSARRTALRARLEDLRQGCPLGEKTVFEKRLYQGGKYGTILELKNTSGGYHSE